MFPDSKNVSVPWKCVDVLLFFFLFLSAQLLSGTMVVAYHAKFFPQEHLPPPQNVAIEEHALDHPIISMIRSAEHSLPAIVVAFLVVVVAAPITEEFLFRMLFQGWLEAKCRSSIIAITTVSFCFALMHGGNSYLDGRLLFYLFIALITVYLLVFLSGIIYLAKVRKVQMIPAIFGTNRFTRRRFFMGVIYCFFALLFIFWLNIVTQDAFRKTNVAPIPIFVFSLVLGILYSKTHNLSYCILLHACLNMISLTCVVLNVLDHA